MVSCNERMPMVKHDADLRTDVLSNSATPIGVFASLGFGNSPYRLVIVTSPASASTST